VVKRLFLLVVATAVMLGGALAACELYLRWSDPFLTGLPFDSNYYGTNFSCYAGMARPTGRYTWGHLVEKNSLGFREREIAMPKPPGVCRVMVLGDSFTFGVGVSPAERYTGVAEALLRAAFPDRQIEVLSFGVSGAATVSERDVLLTHRDRVEPDLIVVGFVFNDPAPRSQSYNVEHEQFMARYGRYLDAISWRMVRVGLGQTARRFRRTVDNLTITSGVVPTWETALDRSYVESSPEWAAFRQALADIRQASDEMELAPPIFAVLNPVIPLPHATDYRADDDSLPQFLRWLHKGERAAAAAGLRTYNHEAELLELSKDDLFVNELDQHPSARVHRIFGHKLFEMIRADIEEGRSCRRPRD
jgi:lysophospholipase L1-like esterase